MPTSYPSNFPVIVRAMERINPHRVLDVGPGYGHYAFAFRERVDDFRWERRIDAIDPCDAYMNRSKARYLYDNVYRGLYPSRTHLWLPPNPLMAGEWHELTWQVSTWRDYDLVLMIDVLEHYEDPAGEEALRHALGIGEHVLVSTPLNYPQGPSHGNPYEEHRSEWPRERLEAFGRWHDLSDGFVDAPPPAPDCVVGVLARP